MNYAIRFDYHLADWDVIDSVGNASIKIDDYVLYGALIGIERKF